MNARLALLPLLCAPGLAQVTVFHTSFDGGAPPEISGVTTTTGVQGYDGVGDFRFFGGDFLRNGSGCPAETTTLTLTGLPAHQTVDLRFLLAIIDTWDGNEPCCGPDLFEVRVDGSLVLSASFKNAFGGGHPYTTPGTLLIEQTQLGFRSTGVNDLDSAFDLTFEPALQQIPHTSSSLVVEFTAAGGGWMHTCAGADQDESWAIDELEVVLDAQCTSSIFCVDNLDNEAAVSAHPCSCALGVAELRLCGATPGQFAYLILGAGTGVVVDPPGAIGDLCLAGAPIGRYTLDAGLTDAAGCLSTDLLNAQTGGGGGAIPDPPGGNICSPPGQTWNFQYWYRNGANPSRFSQGISVTFL